MPVEIEAKMKVADFAPVKRKLAELGAVHRSSVLETNLFFDTDDRTLLAADQGLRLRQQKDLSSGRERFVITFKGPRQHGPLKNREETEIAVDSEKNTIALFEKLGFHRVLSFEKRRESWMLDGCEIDLDELPHLGFYVEIEAPSEPPILELRKKLGLGERPVVKESYIALLMTYLQEHGDSRRVVTFPRD